MSERESKLRTCRVFVYGTLKKGYYNNSHLWDSKLICTATTLPNYLLYDNGHYPCLVKDESSEAHEVVGELYEINQNVLNALDRLEGLGSLYKREEIELHSNLTGQAEKAWVYLYLLNTDEFKECGKQWPQAKS